MGNDPNTRLEKLAASQRRLWVLLMVCGAVMVALLVPDWFREGPDMFAHGWTPRILLAVCGAGLMLVSAVELSFSARARRQRDQREE